MGMKKLSRKRLFSAEKQGIEVDVSPSETMKKAIVSATQHREGHKVITDIVLDLGSSTAGLKTKALLAADPIGATTTDASYICNVTDAVFGVVTTVDIVCLEAISDGTLTDYDVMYAGDGVLDGDVSSGNAGALGVDAQGSPATIATSTGAKGFHATVGYDAEELKNKFIYVTSGTASTQKATATIDCGSADITKIVSGITRIRLSKTDGTTIDVVADSALTKNATTAGKFGMDASVDSTANLALSLKNGIGATNGGSGNFTTSNPTATTVLVTQHSTTATNNGTNYLLDDPEKASLIVVPSFTGGIDDGVAISSGKLLLRFTGFMPAADI